METRYFTIEFTFQEYLRKTPAEREEVFYALYAFFNQEALEMDIPQRLVFDHVFAKTLKDESFEFATILRDFELYFGEEL